MSETLDELNQQNYANPSSLPAGDEQEKLEPQAEHPASANPLGEQRLSPEPQNEQSAVIIDGKNFATEKEAYEYVTKKNQELETEKMLLQAKQEGFEEARLYAQPQNQQAGVQTPEPEVDDSDEFYADPQGYFKKKTASIREQLKAELSQTFTQQQEEERLWQEFFQAHPDLDGFKSDCEMVAGQHAETIRLLAAKDRKKAMDFLATKTRSKFQDYMERLKPRTEMPRQQNAVSTGNQYQGQQVTAQQKNDEDLDFVSQIRNMRNM